MTGWVPESEEQSETLRMLCDGCPVNFTQAIHPTKKQCLEREDDVGAKRRTIIVTLEVRDA